jgi:hypothetical protein
MVVTVFHEQNVLGAHLESIANLEALWRQVGVRVLVVSRMTRTVVHARHFGQPSVIAWIWLSMIPRHWLER